MIRAHKILIITVLSALVLVGLGFAYFLTQGRDRATEETASSNSTTGAEPGSIPDDTMLRLVATGDMIAHDSILANAQIADGYDFYSLMSEMNPYFEQADIRFCNEATPAGGEQFGISGYPVFNAPLEWHDGMEQVGCNVINLGTNHTNDKGQPLIDVMVEDWNNKEVLATAGANRSQAERDDISYFEVKGVRFAFLSYSTYTNDPASNSYGLVMYDSAVAQIEIAEAKSNADFVIVSMRWGDEYSDSISTAQEEAAQDVVDAGADFVFGHGPHVLQPVKKMSASDGREAVVWYSLGNFLNTQIPVEALVSGFAVMDIDISSKTIENVSFLPVYTHYDWTADEATREDLLARENVQMQVLDKSADLLARSQLGTTVEAQTERVREVLNQFTTVEILSSDQY
jgi:poly-gamma-glutamate synthesis protein (capsule biosynthesis protein)